ncbi:MAG TPA: cyclic nucleotide-binding domain-containing protein [Xanthobacteraceae bacterium]|nr:cyclic nucleotide-binding domain-containing protein [Xanthobacteraceae bacterium]
MTIEDDISFLGRVQVFAQLGYSTLQIVAIGSETKQLAEGEILFRAGETTDAGYVIREGALKLTTHDPRRSDRDVTFGPGTLIGELALVIETVCPATAIAVEPTTVIRISRSLFGKVLEGFPDAARLVRDRLAERTNLASHDLSRVRGMLLEKTSH